MVQIYRKETVPPRLFVYLFVLLPVFALMLGGIALWATTGEGWLFALSVLLQMAAYFVTVVTVSSRGPPASSEAQPS